MISQYKTWIPATLDQLANLGDQMLAQRRRTITDITADDNRIYEYCYSVLRALTAILPTSLHNGLMAWEYDEASAPLQAPYTGLIIRYRATPNAAAYTIGDTVTISDISISVDTPNKKFYPLSDLPIVLAMARKG
jgi:hypothetical protein